MKFGSNNVILKTKIQTKQKSILVGIKLISNKNLNNEIPWKIFKNKKVIGKLTSVSYSPRLKYNIGLGIVDNFYSKVGTKIEIEAYDELVPSEIVQLPFR